MVAVFSSLIISISVVIVRARELQSRKNPTHQFVEEYPTDVWRMERHSSYSPSSSLPSWRELDLDYSTCECRSLAPSASPTTSPTAMNTAAPTYAPTGSPSLPTRAPTCKDSFSPTSPPTHEVTHIPTNVPSHFPSHIPTVFITTTPAAHPTDTPSHNPTITPTAGPTRLPSASPSQVPTVYPSALPTCIPTMVPTSLPDPSVVPTSEPSRTPSQFPTFRQSDSPSAAPTHPVTPTPVTLSPSLLPTTFVTTEKPSGLPATRVCARLCVSLRIDHVALNLLNQFFSVVSIVLWQLLLQSSEMDHLQWNDGEVLGLVGWPQDNRALDHLQQSYPIGFHPLSTVSRVKVKTESAGGNSSLVTVRVSLSNITVEPFDSQAQLAFTVLINRWTSVVESGLLTEQLQALVGHEFDSMSAISVSDVLFFNTEVLDGTTVTPAAHSSGVSSWWTEPLAIMGMVVGGACFFSGLTFWVSLQRKRNVLQSGRVAIKAAGTDTPQCIDRSAREQDDEIPAASEDLMEHDREDMSLFGASALEEMSVIVDSATPSVTLLVDLEAAVSPISCPTVGGGPSSSINSSSGSPSPVPQSTSTVEGGAAGGSDTILSQDASDASAAAARRWRQLRRQDRHLHRAQLAEHWSSFVQDASHNWWHAEECEQASSNCQEVSEL